MLSVERVQGLLGKGAATLTDAEIREIRDDFHLLSEIIYESWKAEREEESAKYEVG